MTTFYPHLTTIVARMSAFLGRKLELSAGEPEGDFVVLEQAEAAVPGLGIRCDGDQPLEPEERDLLREMLSLARRESQARSTTVILEDRVQELERRNEEILERAKSEADLALRDPLTGLYSRGFVLEKLEEEMNRAWRSGSPVSLLMIDVDHMKWINETHGTGTGDQVLQAIGGVIKNSCRLYDVPARFTGEQFCLLLPGTPAERTQVVAERIRRQIEALAVHTGSADVHVTSSIGVAGLESIPEEAAFNSTSLLERAGRALATAKDQGRNRTEMWRPSMAARRGAEH